MMKDCHGSNRHELAHLHPRSDRRGSGCGSPNRNESATPLRLGRRFGNRKPGSRKFRGTPHAIFGDRLLSIGKEFWRSKAGMKNTRLETIDKTFFSTCHGKPAGFASSILQIGPPW